MNPKLLPRLAAAFLALLLPTRSPAQVNSGSDGSDGELNPDADTLIDLSKHPDGVFQYTSVTIRSGVTVKFSRNAKNSPVYWLAQGDVRINGTVDLSGGNGSVASGGFGGPGGGDGGLGGQQATGGFGLGGGVEYNGLGGDASFGTRARDARGLPIPDTYGNDFCLPLFGGSGGGGANAIYGGGAGGGGGGGALLIASSGSIYMDGVIFAVGGLGPWALLNARAGHGSGGSVRLVSASVIGLGTIEVSGGGGSAGNGRVRFDVLENHFGGFIRDSFSQGFQPIIFSTPNQSAQLHVASVGGYPVSPTPGAKLSAPDAILSAQQSNPIPITVSCSNIPLNTSITITVKPANTQAVTATGVNNVGTYSSSTATISINMPRGGGLIYATAAN